MYTNTQHLRRWPQHENSSAVAGCSSRQPRSNKRGVSDPERGGETLVHTSVLVTLIYAEFLRWALLERVQPGGSLPLWPCVTFAPVPAGGDSGAGGRVAGVRQWVGQGGGAGGQTGAWGSGHYWREGAATGWHGRGRGRGPRNAGAGTRAGSRSSGAGGVQRHWQGHGRHGRHRHWALALARAAYRGVGGAGAGAYSGTGGSGAGAGTGTGSSGTAIGAPAHRYGLGPRNAGGRGRGPCTGTGAAARGGSGTCSGTGAGARGGSGTGAGTGAGVSLPPKRGLARSRSQLKHAIPEARHTSSMLILEM